MATQINLIEPAAQTAWERDGGLRCTAKIRYNAEPVPATLLRVDEDEIRVEFDEPQLAVAPGQAVCLFDQDIVLGGGWIQSAE